MGALSKGVKTDRFGTPDQAPPAIAQPMDTNTKVYAGSIAITRSGYVTPASSPLTSDVVWGIHSADTDNTTGSFNGGSQGAAQAPIDRGTFWLAYGTGNDAFTQADVDRVAYLIDEVTVGRSSFSRAPAGTVVAVDTVLSKVAVALGVVNTGAQVGVSL